MADFSSWKNSVLGQVLSVDGVKADSGQCSQVPLSWAMAVFPGIAWNELLPAVGNKGVASWAGQSTQYFTWIANVPSDINQLPMQGDILVFGPTPTKGYTNTYNNPYGHTAVCDSASSSGYTIVQQNAPNVGETTNDSSYPWSLNPCLGWFRAVNQAVPAPVPTPAPPAASTNVGRTLILPPKNPDGSADNTWHVYNVDGPYDIPHATHILDPAEFNGLSYTIQADKGNGIYVIDTQDFGAVAIWTSGTNATIS